MGMSALQVLEEMTNPLHELITGASGSMISNRSAARRSQVDVVATFAPDMKCWVSVLDLWWDTLGLASIPTISSPYNAESQAHDARRRARGR
jgi:hypothetical protein